MVIKMVNFLVKSCLPNEISMYFTGLGARVTGDLKRELPRLETKMQSTLAWMLAGVLGLITFFSEFHYTILNI